MVIFGLAAHYFAIYLYTWDSYNVSSRAVYIRCCVSIGVERQNKLMSKKVTYKALQLQSKSWDGSLWDAK